MKTSKDPRHIYRRKMIKSLFAESFHHQKSTDTEILNITKMLSKIDKTIQKAAPTWPLEKINKIDLAILRFAIYEVLKGSAPKKVIIDEAVEIAKEYGSETSSSFVNGVLGTIYQPKKTHE